MFGDSFFSLSLFSLRFFLSSKCCDYVENAPASTPPAPSPSGPSDIKTVVSIRRRSAESGGHWKKGAGETTASCRFVDADVTRGWRQPRRSFPESGNLRNDAVSAVTLAGVLCTFFSAARGLTGSLAAPNKVRRAEGRRLVHGETHARAIDWRTRFQAARLARVSPLGLVAGYPNPTRGNIVTGTRYTVRIRNAAPNRTRYARDTICHTGLLTRLYASRISNRSGRSLARNGQRGNAIWIYRESCGILSRRRSLFPSDAINDMHM